MLAYRNTPHSTTGKTPASLMMDRTIRTKLPVIIRDPSSKKHKEAQSKMEEGKNKQKKYADQHRRAKTKEHKVGDQVLIKQQKTTTKPPFNPDPFTITDVKGSQITAERRSKVRIRNAAKWKPIKIRPSHLIPNTQRSSAYVADSESDTDIDIPIEPLQPQHLTTREVSRPRMTRPALKERWLVAEGPRQKKTSHMQADTNHTYWLRRRPAENH